MNINKSELTNKYHLPVEVILSLIKPKKVETSQGWFTLASIDTFSLIAIRIHQENSPGCFWTPAINLMACSENYGEAKGILLWLPQIKRFGSYDSSHEELFIFLEESWKVIDANLVNFLEAQWKSHTIKYETPKKHIKYFDYLPDEYDMRTLYIQIKEEKQFSIEQENSLKKYEEQLLGFHIATYSNKNLKNVHKDYEEKCAALSIGFRNAGKILYNKADYITAATWYLKSEQLLKRFSIETIKNWRWNFYNDYMTDYFYHGMSLYYSKNYEEAIKHLKHYEDFNPTYTVTLFFIARSFGILGDDDNSIVHYQKAIDLKTTDPYAYSNLGITIANKHKDYNRAISLMEKAIEIDSGNGVFDFNKSCFYALSKQETLAINSLKIALDKGYNNLNNILTENDLKSIINLDATQQLLKQYFPAHTH